MSGAKDSPYREVRSLERGLSLLDAMAELGWSSPAELGRHAAVDRSTAYRLLSTLVAAGYAVRREEDGRYFLASKLRRLGFDIREDDLDAQIAQEELELLVEQIGWPSDYAVLAAGQLTILASTHRLTTMTFFRRLIGEHRPLLRSALGRALLAGMSPRERERALETVRSAGGPDSEEVADPERVRRVVKETQAQGFGSSVGLIDSSTSAIALPVRRKRRIAGAVNIVFFRSAIAPQEAATRFLASLGACVARIEQRLDERT